MNSLNVGDRVVIVPAAGVDYARQELTDVLNDTGVIVAYAPQRAIPNNGHVWLVELHGGRRLYFRGRELRRK